MVFAEDFCLVKLCELANYQKWQEENILSYKTEKANVEERDG